MALFDVANVEFYRMIKIRGGKYFLNYFLEKCPCFFMSPAHFSHGGLEGSEGNRIFMLQCLSRNWATAGCGT